MDKGDATREYRRQQQSSSSSRRQASASATGGIPAVFPPSISGSTFENTQVNLFGLLSNSSIHFHSGHPNSYGRGAVDPRGEVNVGYSQATATPQGSHEAGIPNAGPHVSFQETSDQDPRFDAKPTPEQFSTYVLSILEGNVYFEFYRELGVHFDDERDGGTSSDNVASKLRENPGVSWRRILDALRHVGMADRASDLEKRIRFGSI